MHFLFCAGFQQYLFLSRLRITDPGKSLGLLVNLTWLDSVHGSSPGFSELYEVVARGKLRNRA